MDGLAAVKSISSYTYLRYDERSSCMTGDSPWGIRVEYNPAVRV